MMLPMTRRTFTDFVFRPLCETMLHSSQIMEVSKLEKQTIVPRLLDTHAAAAYLGLATQTIEIFRLKGNGPRFVKMGRAVRYDRADLDSYIETNKRRSTSEAA
jgi:predicted DNA-binding transcriptional regulator AlpA